ncbi:hypothetical protein [Streptomyces sp. NPDC003832]
MDSTYPVRQAHMAKTPVQLLSCEADVLLTVSPAQSELLKGLGIRTVLDLGASYVFGTALTIAAASSAPQVTAGDYTDVEPGSRGLTSAELASRPVQVLRAVDDATATALRDAFGIATVRELAAWPPYTAARHIVADAYGTAPSALDQAERPDDLVPVSRRYATERVQYDVLAFDRVLDPPARAVTPDLRDQLWRRLAGMRGLPALSVDDVIQGKGPDLRTVGGVDVGDLVAATLVAQPALGAVLTYRQSWFPHGLALGHLLHSMALAPGESTRIAMVDWTRRVRSSTDEATAQMERVASDVLRNRALSEVTSSVAREAQSGFSESASRAVQQQEATTYGESKTSVETGGLFGAIGASLFGGELGGPKVTSSGRSTALSTSSGWASTKSSSQGERSVSASLMQNVADRTQQAASSSRNRRATTVVETSQQESETLTTRIVTNYNHMHALTVEYFEVVQIYRVVLELADLVPCLFVPMKLVSFDDEVVQRYRGVIAAAGLTPGVRALGLTTPDRLAALAPRRSAPWDSTRLTEVRRALGQEVIDAQTGLIRLPRNGAVLVGVGSSEAAFGEAVEAIDVFHDDGTWARYPVEDRGDASTAWRPRHGVDLRDLRAEDVVAVSLVRRKDNALEQSVEASLCFDVVHPDGSRASSRADVPGLALTTRIDLRKESATPAFSLWPAVAGQDLMEHLQENALHYSSAIWRSLDAATMTTLLATYTLNGKRLIEVIEPIPLTVTGNYLVFRYPGLSDAEQRELRGRLLGSGDTPLEDLVPLPSGGVFAEAVLGRSNSAEKLDITRFWNWQDSPLPILPPDIAPLGAGGKAQNDSPATGRLESPVVTVVTPPTVPDPTGLAPLYQAVANGAMFRDMSGLAQSAALLQAALQAAQAGAAKATDAAGEAQNVAAQQLTEILKIAAQVALAFVSGGAGAAAGAGVAAAAGAGKAGAAKPGLAPTASNAGALINHGQALDQKKAPAPTPSGAPRPAGQTDAQEGGAASGGEGEGGEGGADPPGGAAPTPAASGPSADQALEVSAFETALGEIVTAQSAVPSAVGGLLGGFQNLLLGATRPNPAPGAPWRWTHRWSDKVPGQTYDHAEGYARWITEKLADFDQEALLCNWFPVKLLVEYAAEHELRVRLRAWPADNSTTSDASRAVDRSVELILASHGGAFTSKDQFYNRARATVRTEMLSVLNTGPVAASRIRPGDMIFYPYSERYWHAEVIAQRDGDSLVVESGNTPKDVPRTRRRVLPGVPANAADGKAKRWDFSQFDG